MDIRRRLALIYFLERRFVVDFTYRKGKGFVGFDADRRRDGILSTQRFRRGRGRDFIYTKNVARARFGFYLRNEFRVAGVRWGLF